ncbi:MAG: dockerin type I repeat-containing protein, partial [Gemmatimonadota bacterium]
MVKRVFRAGFSILFLGLSMFVSAQTAIAQMERGDVNGDGVINVLDALQTVNFVLETSPPPSDQEFWAADCNGDGQANILDVLGIINVILGTGSCVSSCEGLDCDDGNSCTEDYCDSVLVQCVHDTLAPGSPCDDGDH